MVPIRFTLAGLLVVLAGCSSTAERSIFRGDAMCQRTAGSDGGCTSVPSSDAYKEEKERIRENRSSP
jgi:hypothetical protein